MSVGRVSTDVEEWYKSVQLTETQNERQRGW